MPWLLPRGGLLPLVVWCVAAISDYADGPLARHRDAVSFAGAVLDNVADVAFVPAGLGTAAVLGLVSWVVPVSIGLSAGAYGVASVRSRVGQPRLARSSIGHWAGVLNYACLGLVAGAVAWEDARLKFLVAVAAAATAALHLAAVAARWLP